MSFPIPWVGVRRVAIVPVFNRHIDPPWPTDWEYQVRSRMFYDPDPMTGIDRSFQNYIKSLSYGRASIEGEVFPPVVSDGPEVNVPAMKSIPAGHGYKHMVAVLPHSFGQHRGGHAFWDLSPLNGFTAWARVAMYDDRALTVRQPIGVWGMEILHIITEFLDLYNTNPSVGAYDVMAGAGASVHATAHTKSALGWLPQVGIYVHSGGTSNVDLHAISLPQPPPPPRASAVRIPSRLNAGHFMVEARLSLDQYEKRDGPGDGIPADGVIVYEVSNVYSLFLRSIPTLTVGQKYENTAEGFSVSVMQAGPGGFTISVRSTPSPECPRIKEQLAALRDALESETDPFVRRQIRAQISSLQAKARRLGCPA